mmetsp:Transcript_33905/g.82222  ORF Transcript_33905/g.82222 Transcript_33905/m.82222 type:complete len:150 (+) Transcript_33905:122-571(+)
MTFGKEPRRYPPDTAPEQEQKCRDDRCITALWNKILRNGIMLVTSWYKCFAVEQQYAHVSLVSLKDHSAVGTMMAAWSWQQLQLMTLALRHKPPTKLPLIHQNKQRPPGKLLLLLQAPKTDQPPNKSAHTPRALFHADDSGTTLYSLFD